MGEDKREHILDVAEELFGHHGFEGTSVRLLAKNAGVNIAMVSYYFGSKEKLFQAMVRRRAGVSLKVLKQINTQEQDPWKKMEKAINHYVDKIFANIAFQRIMYRELSLDQRSWISEALSDIVYQNTQEMVSIIEEGRKKKIFRKVDAELTVVTIVGTIAKVTLSTLLSCRILGEEAGKDITDDVHRKRVKKHLHDLIKAHLRPEKA
ncbi:MAG: TetR/AcrR family transcriptional regulator [Bacteroidia bacterium]